ncbi:hypothetical protein PQU95_15280 [Vogesella sp. DC21W]|uniref:Uncharacterized protein n=1 Tax=Vogesella aquatica TaxID=2984206 RepID=A0ABT5J167_9NEIS|nr:hypothetical protein [Vogesella aquatica]MDC7718570.1 hypothetical protein [Vogesella aquatica]
MQQTARFPGARHLLASALIIAGISFAHAATPLQQALDYQQYLEDQYGVVLSSDPSNSEFANALGKALQLDDAARQQLLAGLKPKDPLNELNAARLALKAAGLAELAYTYPADKVGRVLAKLPQLDASKLEPIVAQELAAAVDSGLIAPEAYAGFKPAAVVKWDAEFRLLGQTLAIQGRYKRALGNSSDADILSRLQQAWQTQEVIVSPALSQPFDQALQQGVITGYNLKDLRHAPRFDARLTVTYGHSDIRHAQQLLGLLRSEGLNARVQLEPKTSAYLYLKEWGPATASDNLRLTPLPDGNALAYAREYDLSLEFADAAQKDRFQEVVFRYAKKDRDKQPRLIHAAWWQPLYTSTTVQKDYVPIRNTVTQQGHYLAQSYSLPAKAAQVAASLGKLAGKLPLRQETLYVDPPFFNYLNGDSK